MSELATGPAGPKLEKLFIAEVSAVDDPANAVPGWMVAKSADASLSDAEVAGIEVDSAGIEDAPSIVEKIRNLLFGKEIEVTADELKATLDERDGALVEKFAEIVKASVEPAPASEAATEAPAAEAAPAPAEIEVEVVAPALSAEDIAKAIEDGIQPVLEILDKTLDRVEALESRSATRKSIDGQEDGSDEPVKETVGSAIAKALGHGAGA